MRSVGVVVALCLLAPSLARAGDPGTNAKARALYEEATTHYQLAEYRPALLGYTEAYRIKRDAVFLYNIAQCHRQLNEPADAARFYRNYLRDSPNARNRTEVENWIAKMDAAAEAAKGSPSGTLAPEPRTGTTTSPATTTPAPATANPTTDGPKGKRGLVLGVAIGVVALVAVGAAVGIGLGVGLSPAPTNYPTPSMAGLGFQVVQF